MFLTATRSLLRQPTSSLAATATLALGIGSATALFSTVNAALLKPLPYPDAENIYAVRTFFTTGRFTSGLVASEELASLEQMSDAVVATAATMRNDLVIRSGGDARQAVCYGVSEGFFDLFDVRVFGVIAYVVTQRTTEMAVRQALGATRSHVFWMVMWHSARSAGLGLASGLVLAWWTGALLGGYV